jgi:hypothetical protein
MRASERDPHGPRSGSFKQLKYYSRSRLRDLIENSSEENVHRMLSLDEKLKPRILKGM